MPHKDQHTRSLIERDLRRFGPASPTAIRLRTAIPKGSVKRLLVELCAEGKVERVGRGVYQAAEETSCVI